MYPAVRPATRRYKCRCGRNKALTSTCVNTSCRKRGQHGIAQQPKQNDKRQTFSTTKEPKMNSTRKILIGAIASIGLGLGAVAVSAQPSGNAGGGMKHEGMQHGAKHGEKHGEMHAEKHGKMRHEGKGGGHAGMKHEGGHGERMHGRHKQGQQQQDQPKQGEHKH